MNFQPAANGSGWLCAIVPSKNNQFTAQVFMNDSRVDVYIDEVCRSIAASDWDAILEVAADGDHDDDFDIILHAWSLLQ